MGTGRGRATEGEIYRGQCLGTLCGTASTEEIASEGDVLLYRTYS